MMHLFFFFFLHFNPSQSQEKTSPLSIMSAPNMVPSSYVTTGNKHKMTAPNKGTALQGCMDVCPNNTLAWQLWLSVMNIHTNERHVRAMKPKQPWSKEGMLVLISGATVKGSEDIIKPARPKTFCSLLWCTSLYPLTITRCRGRSRSLWIQ